MENNLRCFLRDQLRSARAIALADAEGFHSLIRNIELIGEQLDKSRIGMSGYKNVLCSLASVSPLATDIPEVWSGFHTTFTALFDETKQARNDAVHQGARARTITDHAVELSIILEDALMAQASKVSQFMVRGVVQAQPWHPVSYVRQQMLSHAFSYLPIRHADEWKLVPEYSIAKLLRTSSTTTERRRRLAILIDQSIAEGLCELHRAGTVSPDAALADILRMIGAQPILVIDEKRPDVLTGILTASDIL